MQHEKEKGESSGRVASKSRLHASLSLSRPGLQAYNGTQLNREYSMSHPNVGMLVAVTTKRVSYYTNARLAQPLHIATSTQGYMLAVKLCYQKFERWGQA
jgi:hypothetical protein